AAAANANLDIVEREDLVANTRETGAYFQRSLREALSDHPMVGEVRGVGLLAAVEFVADKDTKEPFDPALKIGPQTAAAALDEGMIVRAMPHGDMLGFAPPLIVKRSDVDTIVGMTERAVAR